ncbi:sirohydrochlorin chelatase [Leptolyngbya sp. FACHB-36]|uniref:sirohydrochlorin chelatase n=1 Tax=Leptolyngbya sp. FACHB-36 TaxID=2692808 RepID=UPI001680A36A|nr:sirohydrochlorin chelatase [Leptolyngbya sp. FACHB-36]MBD2018628.1 sirohydrochlorin chelatase [Leptolyngbya sp. FACHB-36]
MQHPVAYLLVFHGSRDPRPPLAAQTLAQLVAQRLQHAQESSTLGVVGGERSLWTIDAPPRPVAGSATATLQPHVGIASLEGHPLPLHQQIEQFAQTLLPTLTPVRLVVLPLFLLAGVHVMEDIPAELALAQQALGQQVTIDLHPHLGSHPKLQRVITERMATLPVEAWILLAHGSRRAGANQPIEAMAERLGALSAYWSVPPSLESRLQSLIQLGLSRVAILPYFLFSGGITDAIAQRVEALAQQFPTLDLQLTAPLDASAEIADLLVELCDAGESASDTVRA